MLIVPYPDDVPPSQGQHSVGPRRSTFGQKRPTNGTVDRVKW
jgi:hypothetical protein